MRKAFHVRKIIVLIIIAILIIITGILSQQGAIRKPVNPYFAKSPDFSLLLKPGSLVFNEGKKEEKTVFITLEPSGAFREPVNVITQRIAPRENPDLSADGLLSELPSATISPKEYTSGIPILIRNGEEAKKGNYTLILEAKSTSITKTFLLPISVE